MTAESGFSNIEEFYDPVNYDLEERAHAAEGIAFYGSLAQGIGGRVLDVACGSGLVALPLAALGLAVTGVDLSLPMLAHARRKALEQRLSIPFIAADARALPLAGQFDFAFLTGNAFMAFLTEADQQQLLHGLRHALRNGGTLAFETRNPTGHDLTDSRAEELWFDYVNADGAQVAVSGTQRYDAQTQVLHWTTVRRWRDAAGGHEKVTRIACKFTNQSDLNALLQEAGFQIEQQYGDWMRGRLTGRSETIITVCSRR